MLINRLSDKENFLKTLQRKDLSFKATIKPSNEKYLRQIFYSFTDLESKAPTNNDFLINIDKFFQALDRMKSKKTVNINTYTVNKTNSEIITAKVQYGKKQLISILGRFLPQKSILSDLSLEEQKEVLGQKPEVLNGKILKKYSDKYLIQDPENKNLWKIRSFQQNSSEENVMEESLEILKPSDNNIFEMKSTINNAQNNVNRMLFSYPNIQKGIEPVYDYLLDVAINIGDKSTLKYETKVLHNFIKRQLRNKETAETINSLDADVINNITQKYLEFYPESKCALNSIQEFATQAYRLSDEEIDNVCVAYEPVFNLCHNHLVKKYRFENFKREVENGAVKKYTNRQMLEHFAEMTPSQKQNITCKVADDYIYHMLSDEEVTLISSVGDLGLL